MDVSETIARTVRRAVGELDADLSIIGIEQLSTLPHSAVSRVALADGSTVIVKLAGSAEFADGLRREITIYRDVLGQLRGKVAPELLAARADVGVPWLVLEDVSATHRALTPGTPPSLGEVEMFVRTLGRVHAQSMQINLAESFSQVPGVFHVTDGWEGAAPLLDEFLLSFDSDRFPPGTHDLVSKIRDHIPGMVDLLTGPSVLIHGDAHFRNAVYAEDALVLDWALARAGPGEVDLCHALAMNLPRHLASRYEAPALRQYVQTCSGFGVDLDEADVLERYRICLLPAVVVAIGMRTAAGMPASVWTSLLTNAVRSAIDHDALAYLG